MSPSSPPTASHAHALDSGPRGSNSIGGSSLGGGDDSKMLMASMSARGDGSIISQSQQSMISSPSTLAPSATPSTPAALPIASISSPPLSAQSGHTLLASSTSLAGSNALTVTLHS
jgi:hypothetical protein